MSDNALKATMGALGLAAFVVLLWMVQVESMTKAGQCGTPLKIEVCGKEPR